VCLHHFSLPNWFANLGGFLVEENRKNYWLAHVDFVAETFGDLVAGWQPVNETNYYATAAYMARGWPPGHNNVEEWLTVNQQIQLATARELKINIWVCLHHFTLPNWFAKLGGFLVEENRTKYWLAHVDFIAETFGDLVAGWQPVNETNYYATAAYMAHGWPPGHNNVEEWLTVNQQIQLATAEAAVRLKQNGKPVASIFGLSTLELLDDELATHKFAERFYDANWNAGINLFRDGILQIGDRKPVLRPDLAGSFDMIGFSYYSAHGVRNGKLVAYPETEKISPLGYAIWPDGLELVLNRLKKELPNTPLILAEYGVGTSDENERSAYLSAGLDIVHMAIAQGIDVRGFFHWTAVDNYEWLHGYDLQFGIINTDRTTKPSSEVLRQEAKPS